MKSLQQLYSVGAPLLHRVIASSRGDLRQSCLKLWVFGSTLNSERVLKATEEDTYWGLFHMIKKLLLAKRDKEGRLENDMLRLYEDNHITVNETSNYLYTNLPDYTDDIAELSSMMDSLCLVERMNRRGGRRRDGERKGTSGWQSCLDANAFFVLAYSPVAIQHPTAAHRSFSAVKAAQFASVYQTRSQRESLMRGMFERTLRPMESSVPFSDFISVLPSVVYARHRTLFEEMGGTLSES